MQCRVIGGATAVLLGVFGTVWGIAAEFSLELQSQRPHADKPDEFLAATVSEKWPAESTAVIVCDVWDLHHCLNAVRRLEEFAPRLNEVVKEARRRGATIIHAPSDCMPAYADHPARQRALAVPLAAKLPLEIDAWCSRIPSEEQAVYPIDQSDGGEDDDPAEHAEWAAKLKSLGRNPAMPWKKQLDVIEIDAARDFISDRGREVWSILESRGIQNVILTGVHCNMCVLGRPFGLRQMARNGKHVVLMRDMTDCMYNPKRWPFVDHFTGNDLMIAHVERYVCPTITSDQILGGKPFRSKYDTRDPRAPLPQKREPTAAPPADGQAYYQQWSPIALPLASSGEAVESLRKHDGYVWFRCTLRVPESWQPLEPISLQIPAEQEVQAWINGHALTERDRSENSGTTWVIPREQLLAADANLLTLRWRSPSGAKTAPVFRAGNRELELQGRWQFRLDDDPEHANMPLPARFGTATDIVFEPAAARQ